MAKKWKGMVLPDIKLTQQKPQGVDFFSSQAERDDEKFGERRAVSPSSLFEFKDHPFEIRDDEEMDNLMESISENGILTPLLVRPRAEGGYEIISGHRRCHAAKRLGLDEVPIVIREMDDDSAIIQMVDSNLQRENVSLIEKSKAFRMKMDAVKRQGERRDLTSSQVGTKLRADEIVAQGAGESRNQVQRIIRLTNLVPHLQEMVEDKKLKLTPAVEISYLTPEEQEMFFDYIDSMSCTPSLSQAQKLKNASREDGLTPELLERIMTSQPPSVPPREETLNIRMSEIKGFFPKTYSKEQMERHIVKVLSEYFSRLEREKPEQEHEV